MTITIPIWAIIVLAILILLPPSLIVFKEIVKMIMIDREQERAFKAFIQKCSEQYKRRKE